jgi:hypothetical protein
VVFACEVAHYLVVEGAQWWGADLVVEVGGHHGCSLGLQA